jgi:periplasmic protein TonB
VRPAAKAPAETPPPRAEPAAPAAAAPAGTAPAGTAPAGTAQVMDPRWTAAVSGLLAERKIYPEEARRRGEEGRVLIRFTVDRSGRVEAASIVAPSGSVLLDEAALALLRQAVLPAFPVAMTAARITITTTVRYSLR